MTSDATSATTPGNDTPNDDEPGGCLATTYEAFAFDLDGVVYRGPRPVPHAVEAIQSLAAHGHSVVYLTNNAARPPEEVAAQLRGFDLPAEEGSVVTSAQAGAFALKDHVQPGARVLAVGGPGVALALERAGLTAVVLEFDEDGRPLPIGAVDAVMQGYGPAVSWYHLAEAAYAIAAGATWMATNQDRTIPTDRGIAPGNGTLVASVQAATKVDPLVAGKPWPPHYRLAAEVAHAAPERSLAVGDRLDTDIAGAVAMGMGSLHVQTGVHGVRDVCLAPRDHRPTYVGWDLTVLTDPAAEPVQPGTGPTEADALLASLADEPNAHARLRLVVAAAWAAVDDGRAGDLDSWDWDALAARAGEGVDSRGAG